MSAGPDGLAQTLEVLQTVNRDCGTEFVLVRRLAGGHQSGAYLLRDPHGSPAVLKWSNVVSWAPQVLRAAPVVARMRSLGWPTPAWRAVGTTVGGLPYQIQDFVAGTAMTGLRAAEVSLLLELVDSHRGLDPDPRRDWSEYAQAVVFANRDGFRESVRMAGAGGEAVVDAFMSMCAPYEGIRLPGGDLVHGDLSTHNVLTVNGAIAGVIDVEAVGSGTRVIDLAGLLREGYLAGIGEPAAMQRLRHAAEGIAGPQVLRICVAASVFSVLDFMLRRKPERAAACTAAALRLAGDLAT